MVNNYFFKGSEVTENEVLRVKHAGFGVSPIKKGRQRL